ncbi:MAG: GNAT family N-acetyltransferase, partial [bacterium]
LEGRLLGLDGVVEQHANYQKSGVERSYRNIRYEGLSGGSPPAGFEIVPLSTRSFDEVYEYDRPFFPDDRREFLAQWVTQPHGTALGLIQNGKITGYSVLRPCRSGYKIGPLFADTPEFADALFRALKAHGEETAPIYLDTPEVNPEAVALAERYDMHPVFETARMYTGKPPDTPLNRVFGVTTFELG